MHYNNYLVNEKAYALATIKDKLQELKAAGRPIIDMTLGDPLDDTCPAARSGIISYVKEHTFSSYPRTQGSDSYLSAVSSRLKVDYGKDFLPLKHILSCLGTKEAICMLPLVYDWSQGGEIFFSALSYPVYKSSAQLLGVPFQELAVSADTNFFPDLSAISEEQWKSCAIFWLNSPHNPTGSIASREYCLELLELAKKHDFLIASDEAYNELYYGEQPFSFLETDDEHWLVFRTLSKRNNMTGYRAGAMITLNEELCAMLLKLRMPLGTGIPEPIAAAGEAAWLDESHLNENRENARKKRDVLLEALKSSGFEIHDSSAGFYFWISHPELSSSEQLWDHFVTQDLVLTPGTAFGPAGEGYIRMTFACTLSQCDEAAGRIKKLKL